MLRHYEAACYAVVVRHWVFLQSSFCYFFGYLTWKLQFTQRTSLTLKHLLQLSPVAAFMGICLLNFLLFCFPSAPLLPDRFSVELFSSCSRLDGAFRCLWGSSQHQLTHMQKPHMFKPEGPTKRKHGSCLALKMFLLRWRLKCWMFSYLQALSTHRNIHCVYSVTMQVSFNWLYWIQ